MTTFENCLRLTPGVHPFIEAWDCDGLNQVGAFPHFGGRWSEWNGKFRDVVRNFIKVRREGQSMPVLNVHFPHAQASMNIKSSALVSVPILHQIYQGLNHRPPPPIRGLTAPGPHIPSHSLTLPHTPFTHQGSDGPWAGDFASAICGSPNIYSTNQPHESDW